MSAPATAANVCGSTPSAGQRAWSSHNRQSATGPCNRLELGLGLRLRLGGKGQG